MHCRDTDIRHLGRKVEGSRIRVGCGSLTPCPTSTAFRAAGPRSLWFGAVQHEARQVPRRGRAPRRRQRSLSLTPARPFSIKTRHRPIRGPLANPFRSRRGSPASPAVLIGHDKPKGKRVQFRRSRASRHCSPVISRRRAARCRLPHPPSVPLQRRGANRRAARAVASRPLVPGLTSTSRFRLVWSE